MLQCHTAERVGFKTATGTDWCSIALAAAFAQSSAIETLCYRDFYRRLSETRFTAASERVREKLRLRLL